jgi:acyl-CoA thioesterase I
MKHAGAFFLGDSHLAGVGDPTGMGWPARVATAAERAGHRLTIHNLSIPGGSSSEIISSWEREGIAHPNLRADSRAVVSFGVDDVLQHGPATRRRATKNLGHLLDELSRVRLPVYVVGPVPIAETGRTNDVAEISRAFAPICQEREVPYAPLFDALVDDAQWARELQQGDGIHPGPIGYELLATLVIKRGLLDWLLDPNVKPQGLPHRRFAPPRSKRLGDPVRDTSNSAQPHPRADRS